jgi:hypothetical protein
MDNPELATEIDAKIRAALGIEDKPAGQDAGPEEPAETGQVAEAKAA